MNDLEMTRLCAQAIYTPLEWEQRVFKYDPLHDDAQAMGLVKRFKLNIGQLSEGCKVFTGLTAFTEGGFSEAEATDLNRAIVKCVTKMVTK